jgi:hypothetical protein
VQSDPQDENPIKKAWRPLRLCERSKKILRGSSYIFVAKKPVTNSISAGSLMIY